MNIHTRISLLVILLAGILSGCSSDNDPINPNPGSGIGTITGTVVDVMGLPIPGATIVSVPSTQVVVSSGNGTFTIPNIAPGSYSLGITKPGYVSQSQTISVSGGGTATITIKLMEEGLVAAYTFNGSATDVSGNGHEGTITGAVSAANRFGTAAAAMSFDGQSWIEVRHSIDLNFGSSRSFSVVAWIRFNQQQVDFAGIVSKMVSGLVDPFSGFQIFIINSSHAGAQVETIQSRNDIFGSTPIGDDKWHMMTLVVNRPQAEAYLFVDAELERVHQSSTLTADLTNTEPLLIGKDRNSDRFFKGAIDDIRIFDRALSTSEVRDLYSR